MGSIEIPSVPGGIFMPVTSQSVGITSQNAEIWFVFEPGAILPDHDAIIGIRIPPSSNEPFNEPTTLTFHLLRAVINNSFHLHAYLPAEIFGIPKLYLFDTNQPVQILQRFIKLEYLC